MFFQYEISQGWPGGEQHGPARIAIFDLSGRCIRHFTDRLPIDGGRHILQWDGFNDYGGKAPSGIYFTRLALDGIDVATSRVAIIR